MVDGADLPPQVDGRPGEPVEQNQNQQRQQQYGELTVDKINKMLPAVFANPTTGKLVFNPYHVANRRSLLPPPPDCNEQSQMQQ